MLSRWLALCVVALPMAAPDSWADELADRDRGRVALQADNVSSAMLRRHPRERTYMKREWGIEVEFVRQVSGGYMLEFRYKVLDAEKAKPLFERRVKPVLVHTETGARFIVPTPAKTGALRNSNTPLPNHTYWMFFANPGKFVSLGDRVRIEIGDFAVDDLIVQ